MPNCCNEEYVGWYCPKCGLPVSFVTHGGSEPVSIGQISTRNVAINQQLIEGGYIAASGIIPTRIEREFKRGELIGRGGMSNVFLAEKISTGEKVIWKEATPGRFNTLPEVNRRLRDESAILYRLNHPNIPRKVDEGEVNNDSGQDVVVLVMEFIEGVSIKDQMETLKSRGIKLGLSDAIGIVLEICEALEYMADQDPPVYHRDIKPPNIIGHQDRGSVLIDFGLAKGVATGEDVSMSRGASEGWSPPERRDGISGPYTDVYSLSQLLWHLLTGERPFHAIGEDEQAKLFEMEHPGWIADLLRMSSLPYKTRIGTVVEFKIRLENEGEMQ